MIIGGLIALLVLIFIIFLVGIFLTVLCTFIGSLASKNAPMAVVSGAILVVMLYVLIFKVDWTGTFLDFS